MHCTVLLAHVKQQAGFFVPRHHSWGPLRHPTHPPQVLDTIVYADRELLQRQPELARAQVYIHFQSSVRVRRGSHVCES
jgi:hypothetical protein